MRKTRFAQLLGLCLMLVIGLSARAENSQDFGDYVVHFNALTTNFLPPAVAKSYGIKRSQSRGMLNISVLQKVLGMTGKPVTAKISASASNLTGQQRNINLREVHEGNAIYYIGEFSVSNEETLDFALQVTPDGVAKPFAVKFRQQFYTR